MTTRRNNMFYDRGEHFMLNYILKIAESVDSLDSLKEHLNQLKDLKAKWITDCLPGFQTSIIESKHIVTNHYFVKYENQKYSLISHPADKKVTSFILWSDSTSTQCIIDVFSNDHIDDMFMEDNIANVIGIADDWEIISFKKSIEIVSAMGKL